MTTTTQRVRAPLTIPPAARSRPRSWRRRLARHIVPLFVVLTYAWTWSLNIPAALAVHGHGHARISLGALSLGSFSPTIVAWLLLFAGGDVVGRRDLWRRLLEVRIAPVWYLGAVLLPVVSVAAALAVLPQAARLFAALKPWYTPLIATLVLVPLTGFFEEVGWRGLLLDRLLRRMSPLAATAIVGAVWGIWHVPSYLRLMPEGEQTVRMLCWFLVATFPLSLCFTWLYLRTGRRLLPVIVLHAAIDASIAYFLAAVPTGELRAFESWCVLVTLAAALILAVDGALLRRAPAQPS